MSNAFALAALIVFVAGIAVMEHHLITALALVLLAIGVIS